MRNKQQELEINKLLKENGVFFAFSNEQLKKGIQKIKHLMNEGDKVRNCGAGMFCLVKNYDAMRDGMRRITSQQVERDKANNDTEKIILRELNNYEVQYSFDGLQDIGFQAAIKGYNFDKKQVLKVYNKFMQTAD